VFATQGLHDDDREHGGPRRAMRLRIATVLATLIALAVPAAAQAASGSAVIRDCTDDGQLSKHYTAKELADALAHMPADVDEYSDCRDVIRRAQLGAAGGRGTSGGGTSGGGGGGAIGGGGGSGTDGTDGGAATSGPVPDPLAGATDAERASYAKAVQAGAAPVKLDGRPITPGTLGGARKNGLSDVPTPLLVILALLAVGGMGAGALGTRRFVLSRRTV
jgi:hypothetical protein